MIKASRFAGTTGRFIRNSVMVARTLCAVSALAIIAGSIVAGESGWQPAAFAKSPALPSIAPLSATDVSWLFPAPQKTGDLSKILSIKDIMGVDPKDPAKQSQVWSDEAFAQLMAAAASPVAQIGGSKIGLSTEAKKMENWHIAGIRIDAGAPGLSREIINQFGQSPQIRLILQPVTKNSDGTVLVADNAVHLIYSFTIEPSPSAPPQFAQPGCFAKSQPDMVAFKKIVHELADLRKNLHDGKLGVHKVITALAPLGVHPGLRDATTSDNTRKEMKAFLERHLSSARLSAMAVMALPDGGADPWIFLSMVGVPGGVIPQLPNGGFIPVHGPALDGTQFAQMLDPTASGNEVVPLPHTNNLSPISCVNAAIQQPGPPLAQRKGVSTADLFGSKPATPARARQIVDIIADPNKSHFFNTDCVSCHTDTRRAMELLNVKAIPGIDSKVLPNGSWNVRNFGWSPPIEGTIQPTVSRRTSTETAAVVKFINANLLGK